MKIDWKKKLSSRKFWMAVAGFVSGILMYFTSPNLVESISGSIVAFGSIISYILGESQVDATRIEGEIIRELSGQPDSLDCDGSDFPKMGF